MLDPAEVRHITFAPDPAPDGPYAAKWTSADAFASLQRMDEQGRDPGLHRFNDIRVHPGTALRALERELCNPSDWEIYITTQKHSLGLPTPSDPLGQRDETQYVTVCVSIFRWDARRPSYMLGYNEEWVKHRTVEPVLAAIEAALARARVEGGT